jgi:thiol-disulfide isomerase/thioredoxin
MLQCNRFGRKGELRMITFSRRSLVGAGVGLLGACQGPQEWAMPEAARLHPGAAPWRLRVDGPMAPLDAPIATESGARALSRLLGNRVSLISFWATWCPPCFVEKPYLDALAGALMRAGVNMNVYSILALDSGRTLDDARNVHLESALQTLAPMADLEPNGQSFTQFLAAARGRVTLPAAVLLSPRGQMLGAIGAAVSAPGSPDPFNLWVDAKTFDFLSLLAG